MMTLWPRRGCACQAARRPDPITADMSSSPYGGCFRPTKCQGNRVGGIKEIEPAEPNHASDACIAALRAPHGANFASRPGARRRRSIPRMRHRSNCRPKLDLSTPEPDSGKLKGMPPFADRASALDWNGKAGIDYSKPSIPAVTFQPDQLLAGAVPDQSSGVAWATITAPGFEAPLGWDKTSIETRVDPSHEQGKLGTTLSRSVPLSADVWLTLQNGVSMTRALPNATGQAHSWATSQALRFNILPTDTSVSFGADISSTDDKWLRTLSAEQKLFGGPFSVTGSVSET